MRFARDLMHLFRVRDQAAYFSGTLYPDSRMFTGLARETTHCEACLEPDFAVCDFTLGWHLHCCCDRVQEVLFESLLPELGRQEGVSRWVTFSAAKMIQDQRDASRIDLNGTFSLLTRTTCPNGENAEDLVRFHEMIRAVYESPGGMTPELYHRLWTGSGITGGLAGRLVAAMKEMAADTALARRIRDAYPGMLRLGLEAAGGRVP